jgi:hypothetical protein
LCRYEKKKEEENKREEKTIFEKIVDKVKEVISPTKDN